MNLLGIPFTIIYLLQAIIPYWLTGLAPAWAPFSWFCLVIWLLILGAQSLGFLASSFSSNPFIGLALSKLTGNSEDALHLIATEYIVYSIVS